MARNNRSNVIMKERKRWLFFGLPFTFTTYTLTDRKLITKQGFFNTEEDEILLYRVLDLGKNRSLLQKLVGVGDLEVHSSDRTSPKITLHNIRHIDDFYNFLSENVEKERLRVKFRAGEIIDQDVDTDSDGSFDGQPII